MPAELPAHRVASAREAVPRSGQARQHGDAVAPAAGTQASAPRADHFRASAQESRSPSAQPRAKAAAAPTWSCVIAAAPLEQKAEVEAARGVAPFAGLGVPSLGARVVLARAAALLDRGGEVDSAPGIARVARGLRSRGENRGAESRRRLCRSTACQQKNPTQRDRTARPGCRHHGSSFYLKMSPHRTMKMRRPPAEEEVVHVDVYVNADADADERRRAPGHSEERRMAHVEA